MKKEIHSKKVVKEGLKIVKKIEKKIEEISKDLPRMSEKWQNIFVKNIHWLIGLSIVLTFIALIMLIGLTSSLFVLFDFKTALSVLFGVPFMVVILYFSITAYAPLRDKKIKGWNNIFYVQLIRLLYTFLTVFGTSIGNVLSSLVGLGIGIYILFEIRKHYK